MRQSSSSKQYKGFSSLVGLPGGVSFAPKGARKASKRVLSWLSRSARRYKISPGRPGRRKRISSTADRFSSLQIRGAKLNSPTVCEVAVVDDKKVEPARAGWPRQNSRSCGCKARRITVWWVLLSSPSIDPHGVEVGNTNHPALTPPFALRTDPALGCMRPHV